MALRSIFKIGIIGMFGTILSCTLLSAGLAQSVNHKITLEDRVKPDPLVLRGTTGGEIRAAERVNTEGTNTGFCNGFIDEKPNYILVLTNFFEFLKIEVDSQTDTTIIIRGPGGVWCNDDSNNANPAIEGQWQPGKYQIWIGSYQENTNNNYRLKITDNN